jgi:UMF1 family MFS transporter
MIQLDRETFAPERFAGPFVAVWMAVLLIPFFLFMPDGIKGGQQHDVETGCGGRLPR